MKAYIGIDPGSASGCIAMIFEPDGCSPWYKTIEFSKNTTKEWYDILKGTIKSEMKWLNLDIVCVLEKVHGMPGMGVPSITTFAKNVGHIEMALLSIDVPFREVTPQKWMKHYNLKKEKDESKTKWKRRLREHLQRIMPNFKATNDTADAMLIANYAKETCK